MIYLSKGGAGADSDHTWIRPWGGDLWLRSNILTDNCFTITVIRG